VGATVDGVTAVPPGESDCPVALVPPAGTGGPTGTLGAPGSDDDGDCAMGDGVVNDGTVTDAGGTPTVSADAPTGVTGDVHYVDCGYNIVAMPQPDSLKSIEEAERAAEQQAIKDAAQ
jgi:hypothetical protein